MDTTILGSTNVEGFFNIEVPKETNEMLLGFVAMEWTTIKVSDTCSYLEVIMMHCVIYDCITIKKINKKRFKRFRSLNKIHLKAYKQGLFKYREPCVSYIFEEYD